LTVAEVKQDDEVKLEADYNAIWKEMVAGHKVRSSLKPVYMF
jgi:hypothetical protein